MNTTMKTATITDYGTPDTLEIREVPLPVPDHNEALIAVIASTINPVDVKTRKPGTIQTIPHFPATLGWDLAGIVVSAPTGSPVSAGDRVIAMHPPEANGTGCWSQYVTIPVERLAPAPDERLLITGAVGAVGGMAVQLATAAGHTATGVVSRESQIPSALALGAQDALVGTTRDPAGEFDAVLDTAGILNPALLRPGGRLVTVSDEETPEELTRKARSADHNYVGHDPAGLARLVNLVDDGTVQLRVAATFPLDHITDSHRKMETGGLNGKVVVTM